MVMFGTAKFAAGEKAAFHPTLDHRHDLSCATHYFEENRPILIHSRLKTYEREREIFNVPIVRTPYFPPRRPLSLPPRPPPLCSPPAHPRPCVHHGAGAVTRGVPCIRLLRVQPRPASKRAGGGGTLRDRGGGGACRRGRGAVAGLVDVHAAPGPRCESAEL